MVGTWYDQTLALMAGKQVSILEPESCNPNPGLWWPEASKGKKEVLGNDMAVSEGPRKEELATPWLSQSPPLGLENWTWSTTGLEDLVLRSRGCL